MRLDNVLKIRHYSKFKSEHNQEGMCDRLARERINLHFDLLCHLHHNSSSET